MKRRRCVSGAGIAAVTLVLPGCFTYVPVDTGAVAPGEKVQVYLSSGAAAELPATVTLGGRLLRGTVLGWGADTLRIRVPVGPAGTGLGPVDIGQNLELPLAGVFEVGRRQLSRRRTAVLLTTAVAVATAGVLLMTADEVAPEGEGSPSPEVIRIPLFSLPLPPFGR